MGVAATFICLFGYLWLKDQLISFRENSRSQEQANKASSAPAKNNALADSSKSTSSDTTGVLYKIQLKDSTKDVEFYAAPPNVLGTISKNDAPLEVLADYDDEWFKVKIGSEVAWVRRNDFEKISPGEPSNK